MSKRIVKYPLEESYVNAVRMPKGAVILCIKTQYEKPTLWALVNPDSQKETRAFVLKETGAYLRHDNYKYIGTLLSEDGTYVNHCFEDLGG